MKDYRKNKIRFFLSSSFFLLLTGTRISWIIDSALTKERPDGTYQSPAASFAAIRIRLSLSLAVGLAYLIYRIVSYFKKPDRKIKKEEEKLPFNQYDRLKDGASLTYKDYFIGTRREEKKNRLSLLTSFFYLVLACIALVLNPRRRKTKAFFYLLLVLAVILLVFLLLYVLVLPLITLKKSKVPRQGEEIEIDSTRLVIKGKSGVVCYDFRYRDNAKERKDSYLFIYATREGLILTIRKDNRKDETKAFLSDKVKEIRKARRPF